MPPSKSHSSRIQQEQKHGNHRRNHKQSVTACKPLKPPGKPLSHGHFKTCHIRISSAPYLDLPGIIIRYALRDLPDHRKQINLGKRIDQPPRYHHIADQIGQRRHDAKPQIYANLSPLFLPQKTVRRINHKKKDQCRRQLHCQEKHPKHTQKPIRQDCLLPTLQKIQPSYHNIKSYQHHKVIRGRRYHLIKDIHQIIDAHCSGKITCPQSAKVQRVPYSQTDHGQKKSQKACTAVKRSAPQKSHAVERRQSKRSTVIGQPAMQISQPLHNAILLNPTNALGMVKSRIIVNHPSGGSISKEEKHANHQKSPAICPIR